MVFAARPLDSWYMPRTYYTDMNLLFPRAYVGKAVSGRRRWRSRAALRIATPGCRVPRDLLSGKVGRDKIVRALLARDRYLT